MNEFKQLNQSNQFNQCNQQTNLTNQTNLNQLNQLTNSTNLNQLNQSNHLIPMPSIKRFEDLECCQEARKLVQLIYKLTKNDHFDKDFRLVGQITNSAVSSMANIAEGFHRKSNRDFMKFLDYSRASIAETLSHSYVALDQNYISQDELEHVKQQSEVVWKKVNNFITYLSKTTKTNKPI